MTTDNTTFVTPKKDLTDVIGLTGTVLGLAIGFSGQAARRMGADGIHGSYRKGRQMGADFADWTADNVVDMATSAKEEVNADTEFVAPKKDKETTEK